jgi:hypothetical protein
MRGVMRNADYLVRAFAVLPRDNRYYQPVYSGAAKEVTAAPTPNRSAITSMNP